MLDKKNLRNSAESAGNKNQLVKLTRHISYLKMPTNIGVISVKNQDDETEIYLVESGNDDKDAQKILESINENFPGAKIKAVLNTHAHADHCGGNNFLREKTGCEIWASKQSAALMEYPELETQLIWGGTPIRDIQSKFLLAKPCKVDQILDENAKIAIPEIRHSEQSEESQNQNLRNSPVWAESAGVLSLQIISLPGHYIGQTGFLFTDTDGKKVFFGGDSFSGRSAIKRFWIQYLLDETQTKETLHSLSKIKADFYVPGHGEMVSEIEGIAELNLIAILETEDMILDELKTPKTLEEILKAVARRNSIPLKISQYCLVGSTLRSYLSGLYDEGKITYEIQNNKMLWKRA